MAFGRNCLSLDECIELIREGQSPQDVADSIGITESSLARRFDQVGRKDEYKSAVSRYKVAASSSVDVRSVMEQADSGVSLMKACTILHIPRSVVIRKLDDEGRHIEYEVRSIAASHNIKVPTVDSRAYYEGPRETIVGAIPLLPEDMRAAMSSALEQIDGIVRDAATLSRLCRREEQ